MINNVKILGKLLIGQYLKWSVLHGRELCHHQGRHTSSSIIAQMLRFVEILGKHLIGREQSRHSFAVILSLGALQFNCDLVSTVLNG